MPTDPVATDPSVVAALAHGGQAPSAEPSARPLRLLVMMPALNEAATLRRVIDAVPRQIEGVGRVDVLVVDDGSTDDTVKIAREAGASVLSHGLNRGVGAALQTGIDEALRRCVDVAVNIDSDGQFDPAHIPELIAPIVAGSADFVTASRFLDPKLVPTMPFAKRLGNRGMSWLVSTLVGQRFADVSCGFRAYSREALLQLVLTGRFTYTQEMFLVFGARGLRIRELPLPVRGVREHGESRIAHSLWRYAVRTSSIIWGSVRDYRPGAIFNIASLVLLLAALAVAGFFLWHRLTAGMFTPHIWAGFVAAFLCGLSLVLFALGQVAVMVSRLRALQERQLYLLRRYLQREDPPP